MGIPSGDRDATNDSDVKTGMEGETTRLWWSSVMGWAVRHGGEGAATSSKVEAVGGGKGQVRLGGGKFRVLGCHVGN